jgi:hypothetical protein
MSQIEQRSQSLRVEALEILNGGLITILERDFGVVRIAGSVQLDLMAVPDIDLYLTLEANEAFKLLEVIPKLAVQLELQGYAVAKTLVRNEHVLPDPKFPATPGLYAAMNFLNNDSGELWKLDLWGWSHTRYDVQRAHHAELQRRLAGVNSDLVLRLKHTQGYGETFFSVDVYEFALAGVGDSLEDFQQFLLHRSQ